MKHRSISRKRIYVGATMLKSIMLSIPTLALSLGKQANKATISSVSKVVLQHYRSQAAARSVFSELT